MTCSRSRPGGGPPSLDADDEKNRDTENVEHGGEAMTARNSPAAQRWSSSWQTESRRGLCRFPP
eukprot:88511-Pleurochrysis_carterae.AAC.1